MQTEAADDRHHKDADGWIETVTGGQFHLSKPTFRIEDIGHALAMTCRYNGHVSHFYSVAEHSVLVSEIMERYALGDPMEGLLHDATEAYLSDVPAPFKQYLPDWGSIDKRLEAAARKHFRLPAKKTDGLVRADMLALFMEAHELMPGRGANYLDPLGLRQQAIRMLKEFQIYTWVPQLARSAFLNRYEELTKREGAV